MAVTWTGFVRNQWGRWCEFNNQQRARDVGMQRSESQEFFDTKCQRKASPQQVPGEEPDMAAGKTYMELPADE